MKRSLLVLPAWLSLPVPGWTVPTQLPVTGADGVPALTHYLTQSFLALLLVVAGIFLLIWLLRRYGGLQATSSGRIRILDGISVGQRERILLLRIGSSHLVVGVGTSGISDLGRVELSDDAGAVEQTVAPMTDFRTQLTRLLKRSAT